MGKIQKNNFLNECSTNVSKNFVQIRRLSFVVWNNVYIFVEEIKIDKRYGKNLIFSLGTRLYPSM